MIGRKIYKPPFGYVMDEDYNLIIDEDEIDLLAVVADLIKDKEMSIRDGVYYISSESKRTISYEGLRKRLKQPLYLFTEDGE